MDSAKSFYGCFAFHSEVERKFAEKLEGMDSVRFFVKLPGWFKVQTPIGNYNPDWGIVMEEVDQFADKGQRLYLVRETESTKVLGEMRPSEAQKLKCGKPALHRRPRRRLQACGERQRTSGRNRGEVGKSLSLAEPGRVY